MSPQSLNLQHNCNNNPLCLSPKDTHFFHKNWFWQHSLTLSILVAIWSQWALVMSTPSCWHSVVIFSVRNLGRRPLNYMCYLRGFLDFAARPMLFGAFVRCPTAGKACGKVYIGLLCVKQLWKTICEHKECTKCTTHTF